MSAYTPPRPDCPLCEGTGQMPGSLLAGVVFDMLTQRCTCTDPKPAPQPSQAPAPAQEGRR